MLVKFIIEFDDHRQVSSLDEFAKSVLEAIRTTIRQEVERLHSPGEITATPPAKDMEVNPPCGSLENAGRPGSWRECADDRQLHSSAENPRAAYRPASLSSHEQY
jgi:hypothetical protein